jgi:hypothetical protein
VTLFAVGDDAVATTSDDCYTPRWVFDAMGLQFDLDVAAPVGGPWHVPCARYYTAADDGLAQPWDGLVWCNPPYSRFMVWAERWTNARGALMGLVQPLNHYLATVFDFADVVTFMHCEFARPDGTSVRLRQSVFVAFRDVGTEPAERLAAADPYGAVLYGKTSTAGHTNGVLT